MPDLVIPSLARLSEHVRALRHGALEPPEGRIPAALADLLRDVLHQPDEVDPAAWLRSHRARDCAIATLGLALKLAIELGRARLGEPADAGFAEGRGGHDSDLRLLFGQLVTQGTGPLRTDWELASSLEEALPLENAALVRVRRVSGLTPGQQAELSRYEPGLLALLADLLRLPADGDPIGWLISERAGLCSIVVLRYLLDSVIPGIENVDRDVVLRRVRPGRRCRSAGGLDVKLHELVVHPTGFTAQVEATFSLPAECATSRAWCNWEGFERVFDSHGRYYVARPLDRRVANVVWPGRNRRREKLVLLCVPSLEPGVVTFESPSAALSIYRTDTKAGQLVAEPSPNLGSLACTVEA